MQEYSIGGQEVRSDDANEAIADIPQNKTLLVQKLTALPPVRPQMVYNLQTVDDVFQNFKPSVNVNFKTAEGGTKSETLRFSSLGDFGKNGLINQSKTLQDLASQVQDFHQMIKQFKSNKILKAALSDPESRQAYLQAINLMIEELEQAK